MATSPPSGFEQRRPQQPDGMGRGALFALLVHVGLIVAIAFGVSWRSSEPAGTSAELWAAVPQVAAPAAVEPPPPPPPPKVEPKPEVKPEPPPPPPKPDTREADIALEKAKAAEKEKREREEREKAEKLAREKERERLEKLEREKAEKERLAQAEKEKRAREEKERREAEQQAQAAAKAREDYLKRITGQAGATGGPQSTGTAMRDAGPSASYTGKIIARVRPNIVLTDSVPPTLRAEVEVRVAPDGTITARRLMRSSGNQTWDDAVLRAIDRTETLPKDENGRIPSPMTLIFTPA